MTYRLALFGATLSHSLSPELHQGFAHDRGFKVDYQLLEITSCALGKQIGRFFATGGWGANITYPFKASAFEVVDQVTDEALQAGVVNTIYLDKGRLIGHNTDGLGFMLDCQQKGITLENRTILMLGAGGAARGLMPHLLNNAAKVFVANRHPHKVHTLCTTYPQIIPLSYEQVGDIPPPDIIINATSMSNQGLLPSIPAWLYTNTICIDLAYGQNGETIFTQAAKKAHCQQVFDGLGMLTAQARLAFNTWFAPGRSFA